MTRQDILLHVINPNSTASMTDAIGRTARSAARPTTRLLVQNPANTPPSLEGATDEALAIPAILAAITQAERDGARAHIIACFDDPGMSAAREIATRPVIGLCQAAIQTAMILSTRFTIITTLPRAVPHIENLAARYGAEKSCRRVRAIDCPVLELETCPDAAMRKMGQEIARAKTEDNAEAIILGCAGMVEMPASLSRQYGLPVIDGVTCAVLQAEALATAEFLTSTIGASAVPRAKTPCPQAHRMML